jgi:phosphoribosylformylglycinamidine cyclo-ligase
VSGGKTAGDRSAYTASGVDVEAGDRAVELMRASVASTLRPEILGGLGGFGSAFTIPAGYREPVIVSSTDGVGTKTAIAGEMGRLDTVGIDLVAMCADDVVCTGAEPVAFLDYIAVGRLVPERVASLVAGIVEGCRQAGSALVGGETAEHPGLMAPDDFDLAGFSMGVGERSRLLDGTAARIGDAIVGLASSGLHSNGYSLVRKVVRDADLALDAPFGEVAWRAGVDAGADAGRTLGEVLLTPTRIYARDVLAIRAELSAAGHEVRGIAHITGGGVVGNVTRAIPAHLAARVRPETWPVPPVIRLISSFAGLSGEQQRATFNAGVGMALVVPADAAGPTVEIARARGVPAWVIGDVVDASPAGGRRYIEVGSGA